MNESAENPSIEQLKEAVQKNSEDDQAYLKLGNAWLREYNGVEALNAFRQVVRLRQDCAEGHFGLGKAFDSLQRYENWYI